MPLIFKDEGLNGFYKGLVPLWMRQIPYTMMKFACFEKTIELLYRYVNCTNTTNLCVMDKMYCLPFLILGIEHTFYRHHLQLILTPYNRTFTYALWSTNG